MADPKLTKEQVLYRHLAERYLLELEREESRSRRLGLVAGWLLAAHEQGEIAQEVVGVHEEKSRG